MRYSRNILRNRYCCRGQAISSILMEGNRPKSTFDRVVFGVNSSPFQAQYVLQQHAKKFQSEFPLGAETVQKSTYMDDSMDSVLSEVQVIELYKQLSFLISKAGMHARKWLSNSSKVVAQIPVHDRKAEVDLDHNELPCAKHVPKHLVCDGWPRRMYLPSRKMYLMETRCLRNATF